MKFKKLLYGLSLPAVIGDSMCLALVTSFIFKHQEYSFKTWLVYFTYFTILFIVIFSLRLLNRSVEENLIQDEKNKLIHSKISDFLNSSNGKYNPNEISNLMINDLKNYEEYWIKNKYALVKTFLELVISIILLLMINYKLALLTIFINFIPVLVKEMIDRFINVGYEKFSQSLENFTKYIQEIEWGKENIKIYQLEKRVSKSFFNYAKEVTNTKVKYNLNIDFSNYIVDNLSNLTYLITYIVGMYFIANDLLTFSLFIIFTQMTDSIIYPIQDMIKLMIKMKSVRTIKERLEQIKPDLEKNNLTEDFTFDHQIILNNVKKNYDHEISLEHLVINKGEKVLLMGRNGCGKSTICKMIAKLITLDEGGITIDHQSIKTISEEQLYQKLKYISENDYIFDDTILNNLLLGLPQEKLPTSMPLFLSEHYHQSAKLLSGGQKQILILIRNMVRQPSILILDEALSGVSKDNTQYFLETLQNMPNLTVIQIDHHFDEKNKKLYDHIYTMV